MSFEFFVSFVLFVVYKDRHTGAEIYLAKVFSRPELPRVYLALQKRTMPFSAAFELSGKEPPYHGPVKPIRSRGYTEGHDAQ